MPQSYGNSIALQSVSGPETDHSMPLEGDEPPRSPYGVLTLNGKYHVSYICSGLKAYVLDFFFVALVKLFEVISEDQWYQMLLF